MKILIVDDSPLDRRIIINILEKAKINNAILKAADGIEALRILRRHSQDIGLILLDLQMPNMDGFGLMRELVKGPKISTIPIVMITTSSSAEDQKTAKLINPDLRGYIIKPVQPKELMETITPYLKGSFNKNKARI